VPPLPPPPGGPQSSRPPGRPVGPVTLLDTERREWDLATSRHGSLVLVEFMTTTCVPCKKAIPVLTDLQARYGAAGLQVVGVVCDDGPLVRRTELAKQYRSAQGLNYALYVEPGPGPGAVRDRLGVEGYPTVILVDGTGREVYRGHPTVDGEPAKLEQAIRENLGK
jgi:thiol-disulfide isomerase/thioredoxin